MTINITHESMRRAVQDLDRASHRLADEWTRADHRVSGFLRSGWTGVAADRFDGAWQDWIVAAGQVHDGLRSMSDLLSAVHADFIRQDDESQRGLDAISQRIVDRLG